MFTGNLSLKIERSARMKKQPSKIKTIFLISWLVFGAVSGVILYLKFFPRAQAVEHEGGVSLLFELDTQEMKKKETDWLAAKLKEELSKTSIPFLDIYRQGAGGLEIEAKDPDAAGRLKDWISREFRQLSIEKTSSKSNKVYLNISDAYLGRLQVKAMDNAVIVIETRLDELNMLDHVVFPRGEKQIWVEIPGVQDTERIKRILTRSALLEFKLVDDKNQLIWQLKDKLPKAIHMEHYTYLGKEDTKVTEAYLTADGEDGRKALLDLIGSIKVPVDLEIALSHRQGPQGKEYRTYLLRRIALLNGETLEDSRVSQDPETGTPEIAIKFNEKGAKLFEKITAEHIKERLAIMLDGKVISAPLIMSPISGGRARITLGNPKDYQTAIVQAHDLAGILRSGAMPAKIRLVEEKVIKPKE